MLSIETMNLKTPSSVSYGLSAQFPGSMMARAM